MGTGSLFERLSENCARNRCLRDRSRQLVGELLEVRQESWKLLARSRRNRQADQRDVLMQHLITAFATAGRTLVVLEGTGSRLVTGDPGRRTQ